MPRPRIYLAGPEVFLPDAVEIGHAKCRVCTANGCEGLYPVDGRAQPDAAAIYAGNIALMDRADAIVANVTPFRGPGADAGTAFEMGYMVARGRPLFAYSHGIGDLAARTRAALGVTGPADAEGLQIEDFGLPDNLMLAIAVANSGAEIIVHPQDEQARYRDLAAFERCVVQAAKAIAAISTTGRRR